jgi:hypothetical protein
MSVLNDAILSPLTSNSATSHASNPPPDSATPLLGMERAASALQMQKVHSIRLQHITPLAIEKVRPLYIMMIAQFAAYLDSRSRVTFAAKKDL